MEIHFQFPGFGDHNELFQEVNFQRLHYKRFIFMIQSHNKLKIRFCSFYLQV